MPYTPDGFYICVLCGTRNDPRGVFCARCGSTIPKPAGFESQPRPVSAAEDEEADVDETSDPEYADDSLDGAESTGPEDRAEAPFPMGKFLASGGFIGALPFAILGLPFALIGGWFLITEEFRIEFLLPL